MLMSKFCRILDDLGTKRGVERRERLARGTQRDEPLERDRAVFRDHGTQPLDTISREVHDDLVTRHEHMVLGGESRHRRCRPAQSPDLVVPELLEVPVGATRQIARVLPLERTGARGGLGDPVVALLRAELEGDAVREPKAEAVVTTRGRRWGARAGRCGP
jgi:hypothetical protein